MFAELANATSWLWQTWLGLDDHTQTLIFAAILACLAYGSYWLVRRRARNGHNSEPETLSAIRALAYLLIPVWVLLAARILWGLWELSASFDPTVQGSDLRWHILAFIGLVTALGAIVSAPLALIRVWTTERQTRTAEQGHMTDRISKAVEQLGAEKTVSRVMRNVTYEEGGRKRTVFEGRGEPAEVPVTLDQVDYGPWEIVQRTVPNIEVRIGGLLSLERIAQDSTRYDKGRDHVRVMEILCAYIRENAPASGAKDFPLPEWEPLPDDATDEDKAKHLAWHEARFKGKNGPNAWEWVRSLPDPRADIALALQIIGRRDADQRLIEAFWRQETSSNPEWVFDIPCPVFAEAPKGKRHSQGVVDAYNYALDIWKTRVSGYQGYRPDLRNTNLQRADLSQLTLSGAWLNGARMEGAYLGFTRIEGANLSSARMEGAVFTATRMQGADLSAAVLHGAALNSLSLLACAISQEQVNSCFGDASVFLPKGISKPANWLDSGYPDWDDDSFYDEWRKWQADPDAYSPPPKPTSD